MRPDKTGFPRNLRRTFWLAGASAGFICHRLEPQKTSELPPASSRRKHGAMLDLPKKKLRVEGATQKSNGKWANKDLFPGREFDDLDAYRAAKKQHYARREEFRAQARDNRGSG